MRAEFLAEPELEFGGGGRHIDIRYGLTAYGPFDVTAAGRPTEIAIGLVGTPESTESVMKWLDDSRAGVTAKASRLRHLYPAFPGFSKESPFGADLMFAVGRTRQITSRVMTEIIAEGDRTRIVEKAVSLFVQECAHIVENYHAAVLICAPPAELFEAMDPPAAQPTPWKRKNYASIEEAEDQPEVPAPAFHDLLKARGMALGVPIQMVRPETYDPEKRRRQKARPEYVRQLQDEATRAWNFHTALYYKAGGTPWRLPRVTSELTACFVGVSFYKTAERDRLMTSMAQVFNERGDGVVVRGGAVKIDKDDRQPHLTRDGAAELLHSALATYRAEHKALPARLVIHKTSAFNDAERAGVRDAAKDEKVDWVDLISLRKSRTRLFRYDRLPPLRGTLVSLEDHICLLYGRGSVDFFECYPGLYVPRPLEIRFDSVESTPRMLATEILALSKMSWNNTQFDGGEPVTTRVARQVGDILRHVPYGAKVQPRYSFYM